MDVDYAYVCMNLCSITGLQVRMFWGEEMTAIYQNAEFSPDPVVQVLEEIQADESNVSYWVTEEYLYYGAMKVREQGLTIIIGPTMQIQPDKSRALSILFALGEPRARLAQFMAFLETIPAYPLLNFVQILCTTNYFLNGEKLVPSDLILQGGIELTTVPVEAVDAPEHETVEPIHNTYDYERTLFSYLRHGQIEPLEKLLNAQPTGTPGRIAYDELRQQKNLFVCATTLATRSAIEGGLDRETAFSLSDLYIQSMERLYSLNDISKLATKMLMDFTERVAAVLRSGCSSELSKQVHNFIVAHMDRRISTGEVAQTLQVNRSYLCEQFKHDTGKSLNTYITELKINEAKRLLRVTKKPVIVVSDQLGFSSQSYFQNVFKKITGKTPKLYRKEAIL
jgi:AraC-like DNA-binding protein